MLLELVIVACVHYTASCNLVIEGDMLYEDTKSCLAAVEPISTNYMEALLGIFPKGTIVEFYWACPKTNKQRS